MILSEMCRSPLSSYLYQGEITLTFLPLFSVVESWKSGLICDCSALLSLQQWLHVFSILFLKPEHCCEQGPRSPSLLAITLPSLIYTTFFLQDCLEYLCYPEMHLNTGCLFIFCFTFSLQPNSQVSSLFSVLLSTSFLLKCTSFFPS